jgi:hypothetical protein
MLHFQRHPAAFEVQQLRSIAMEMRVALTSAAKLSEDDLFTYLRTSVPEITKRRISNWRAKRLLPAFDIQGGGSGAGAAGRAATGAKARRLSSRPSPYTRLSAGAACL